MLLHSQQYFRSGAGQLPDWYFLALWLWLLLTGVGLLALGLVNAFRRRVRRTLAWLGLSVLAFGSCAAAAFPVMLSFVGAPSMGEPPPGSPERIGSDRVDSLYTLPNRGQKVRSK